MKSTCNFFDDVINGNIKNEALSLFASWYSEHRERTKLHLPATCCLSTNGLDGYPNCRNVALKEITEEGFIITGSLKSLKGREIARSEKIALTFWWPESERQVRIQGDAVVISDELADKYFSERSRDSRIVSLVSEQGGDLADINDLMHRYDLYDQSNEVISRPEHWGGYLLIPIRIEFLEFKSTRFHDRTLYERKENKWLQKKLQP